MTAKKKPTEKTVDEWIRKFQKLIPSEKDSVLETSNQDQMTRLIITLYKRRKVKANFHQLWSTLFWIPKLKSRIQARVRHESEFKGRVGETTPIREWARTRNRLRQNLPILLSEVEDLFEEAYHDGSLFRTLLFCKKVDEDVFKEQDQKVLRLAKNLRKALPLSPLFLAEPFPRPHGHQAETWLQDAQRSFKKAGVPQTIGNELLRLIGVKPPHQIHQPPPKRKPATTR